MNIKLMKNQAKLLSNSSKPSKNQKALKILVLQTIFK